jgi:hypothetical protein
MRSSCVRSCCGLDGGTSGSIFGVSGSQSSAAPAATWERKTRPIMHRQTKEGGKRKESKREDRMRTGFKGKKGSPNTTLQTRIPFGETTCRKPLPSEDTCRDHGPDWQQSKGLSLAQGFGRERGGVRLYSWGARCRNCGEVVDPVVGR